MGKRASSCMALAARSLARIGGALSSGSFGVVVVGFRLDIEKRAGLCSVHRYRFN